MTSSRRSEGDDGSLEQQAISSHQRTVVLFTKPAVAGRVKTRMTPRFTAEEACELHQALLRDVLRQTVRADAGYELEIAWAVDEGEELPTELPLSLPLAVRSRRQRGDSLGDRLVNALLAAVGRGASLVAAIGSDHPELSSEAIEGALGELERCDVVIWPASDGGYSLIGLRAQSVVPELFRGVPWSTERVFADTVEKARALGLRVSVGPLTHDIDEPADLEALWERCAQDGEPVRASDTLALARTLLEKPPSSRCTPTVDHRPGDRG